ncbi:hypothetical protein V8C35DRAFT_317385 [Trichoderma chlorosporum]
MEALKKTGRWTAIELFRIAMNDESQITLMIAVQPGTLSWSDGYAIAMQCKSIFEAHVIHARFENLLFVRWGFADSMKFEFSSLCIYSINILLNSMNISSANAVTIAV